MTLEASQFMRLQPRQSYTKRLAVALTGVAPGTYRVRLAYAPRAAGPSFSFPEYWQDQHHLVGSMWLGMAFSNEVSVTVTP